MTRGEYKCWIRSLKLGVIVGCKDGYHQYFHVTDIKPLTFRRFHIKYNTPDYSQDSSLFRFERYSFDIHSLRYQKLFGKLEALPQKEVNELLMEVFDANSRG